METKFSLTCSQQPATEQIASVTIFTPSISYITFNIIRYLRQCPVLNFLRISNVKHYMIHNLNISYDFISAPIFVPHQLQHNILFTLSLRYLINADRSYGYSQSVAIRCEVSETLSTKKVLYLLRLPDRRQNEINFYPSSSHSVSLTAIYFVHTN